MKPPLDLSPWHEWPELYDVAEARHRAEDLAAVERGRAQIAAGQSHDMDDVLREMEDIVHGRQESRSGGDSST